MTWHSVHLKCYQPICSSLRLKSRVALVVRQPIPLDVTPEEPFHGGYSGVCERGAESGTNCARERPCRRTLRSPNTHQLGQPGLRHVRSSKFAAVRFSPAAQATRTAQAPPPMPKSRRPTQPRSLQQRDYLRWTQCGSDPEVYTGNADHGVMVRMGQKHGELAAVPRKCFVSSFGRPAHSVTPFDRGGAIAAIIARRTLQLGTSQRVTSFKIDDRTQPPHRYSRAGQTAARRLPQSLGNGHPALPCLSATAWAESLAGWYLWPPVLGRLVPLSLPLVACRDADGRRVLTETRN